MPYKSYLIYNKRKYQRKKGAIRDTMATIIFVIAVLLILLVASVVKFVGLVIEFVIENVVVSIIIALVTLAILVVWFGYFNPKGKRERLAEEARQLAEENLLAEENRRRRQELMSKYQDEEVVERIMTRRVWTGQTAEMLMDALGPPEAVDVKLLKTKKKEI